MARQLKILFFDIETAPLLAHVWRTYKENVGVDQLVNESFMLTWAAKWQGKKGVLSDALTPDEIKEQDDTRIVSSLAELIREADIVVAHNVTYFDIPTLNGRVMKHGLEPLGPTQMLDTLLLARRNFKLPFNKLDYLGEFLGLGRKIKVDFELWRKVYLGDSQAITQMVRYNKQDVVLLEKVYEKMLPYVSGAPRLYEAEREMERACPFCGSDNLQRRGYHRTKASTFVRFQCNDCRKFSRTRSSEVIKKLGLNPL